MTEPRRVVVALHSVATCHVALEAGVELASVFRSTVLGLYVEDRALPELGELPAPFLPAGLRRGGAGAVRQAMAAAAMRESRRVHVELERFAAAARAAHSVTVSRSEEASGLERAVVPGDIVVVTVDMSEPRLSEAVAQASRLCPPEGGVLVVPERRPSRTGAVVAVAAGDDPALGVAAKIAAGLGAPVVAALAGGPGAPPDDAGARIAAETARRGEVQIVRLGPEGILDAMAIGPAGARLLVCRRALLDRIRLDGAEAPMRRFRAPLLILADPPKA